MAGNSIVMPFQHMCECGNGNEIGFPEQFFPILQGNLEEGVQDHLIHPLLGIAEQEDEPDPFGLIERRKIVQLRGIFHGIRCLVKV